jgi:hypothetical protein
MGLLNINSMMPGVGLSTGEVHAIEDNVTGIGALATPPSNGGQSINTMGNANYQTSAAGVSPGATGADNVIAVYTLPASAFDKAGRVATIQAWGSFAANGDTKTIKIVMGCTAAVIGSTVSGGTAVASTGAVATNGGGWAIAANVAKYGAAASNTQQAIHSQAQVGAAVSALLAPQALTMTENLPIIVAVTANCATTATDVVFSAFELTWSN